VELQALCSGAWVDISKLAASVAVDGGDFDIGEIKLFGEDHPSVAVGKHNRMNVTIRALYTEDALEPYELVKTAYETYCDHGICARWTPLGDGTPGNNIFTTISGVLTTPVYPAGDASSADPCVIEFTITCPRIEESAVA